VKERILNFSLSRPHLLLNLCVAVAYERASSSITFLSKDLPTCAIDDVVKPTDCAVRTGSLLLSPHKTGAAFRSVPIRKLSWKLPKNRIFKPKQNILHDT